MSSQVKWRTGLALVGVPAAALVIAVAMTVSGGDSDGDRPSGCASRNSSLPAVGARLAPDGRSVRFAYAGAEPCQFAATAQYEGRAANHERTLYVELRTNTDLEDIDRRPPLPSGCIEGILKRPVRPGTPVNRVYGNKRLLPTDEVRALLSPGARCEPIVQGEPAFIID